MSYKGAGLPYFNFTSPLFRSSGFKIPNKAEALLWADKTVDSTMIDRIGKSTFEPLRPAYAVGDDATYFDLQDEDGVATEINLGTNHTIECEIVVYDDFYPIVGNSNDTSGLFITSANGVRYRASDEVSLNFTKVLTVGNRYNIKVIRESELASLYVDGIFEESLAVALGETVTVSKLMKYTSETLLFQGSCSYIDLNGYIFNPQCLINADGTFNDFVPLSHADGEADVFAQQMSAPAIRAIQDDSLSESYLNESGYLLAETLGKNLFNKDGGITSGNFLDSSDNEVGSGAYSYSDYIYLDDDVTTLKFSPVNGNSPSSVFYDENKGYISGFPNSASGGNLTKPSNAKYIRVSVLDSTVSSYQLEQGTTATTYEAWQGYYTDEALTIPYPTGYPIPPLTGTSKSVGWIDDGTGTAIRAPRSVGPVKINPRIVDGVVSLSLAETTSVSSGVLEEVEDDSALVSSTGQYSRIVFGVIDMPNTLHTIEFSIKKNSGTAQSIVMVTDSTDTSTLNDKFTSTYDTPMSFTFTPNDGGINIRLYPNYVVEVGEALFYDVCVYEGTVKPTTGEFVDGNSWTLDEAYNKAVKADTDDYLFDDTDPTEVVRKLLPCDTANRGDYLFTSEAKQTVAVYNPPQTGENLTKIKAKLEIV